MNNKLLLTLSCSVLFMGLAACDSEPKKEEVKQAATRNGASEDWTDNSKDKQETKSTFKKVSMDQYIVHPILCLILGYSYASTGKIYSI
ncbi:TPA: hypothetical protein ACGXMA_002382 [Bacillus cereus]